MHPSLYNRRASLRLPPLGIRSQVRIGEPCHKVIENGAGGVFSGKLVAHGTGAFAGQILRGSLSQTAPNRIYFLTGTILTTGS